MFFNQTQSGLLLVTDKQPAPPKCKKPPEHGARKDIRAALTQLDEALGHYAHTTHGRMFLDGVTIEGVAGEIAKCYAEPTSYRISNLSMFIAAFIKQEEAE